MSNQILVPALGESVTEATVAKWLKSEGDRVNVDEAIVELETDKVNVEVPAPSSGVIEKIAIKEGQTVNVGTLLGTISQSKKSCQQHYRRGKKIYTTTKETRAFQSS
jgi:2-oxoglutarate dehydrogenase E2 component (dihydrolipoamide succinyltransferase)